LRYGIGVGREGFAWSGTYTITRKAEWPGWTPQQMVHRRPYLPRFIAGGPCNPLGARAMYPGETIYRIHGTNQPGTIGRVSSGCIRLVNEDIVDLHDRLHVGTKVIVFPAERRADTPASFGGRKASTLFGACILSPECSPLREADAADRRDCCLTFPAPHSAYRRRANGGRTLLRSYIVGISGSPSIRFQETPCALE
jgi:hypothetical protein